jgi:hypothetical protein
VEGRARGFDVRERRRGLQFGLVERDATKEGKGKGKRIRKKG